MSSQSRTREEERRFNVRTLVFASIGAAVAAIVTSRIWVAGTPVAAAMTPVIVALVSELLHRPTDKIAQRFTSETDALPDPERRPREVTVYKTEQRDLPWGKILATGLAAFLIGAAILTVPELLAGQSFGKGDGPTSILGNNRDRGNDTEQQAPEDEQTVTETVPGPAQPAPQTTTPQAPPATTPQQTTPAPQSTPTTPTP